MSCTQNCEYPGDKGLNVTGYYQTVIGKLGFMGFEISTDLDFDGLHEFYSIIVMQYFVNLTNKLGGVN